MQVGRDGLQLRRHGCSNVQRIAHIVEKPVFLSNAVCLFDYAFLA
ncbi:hypothetical protein BURMUCF1_0359 [Burkholderia multivorans ATCC BAA-247]|nr:hypothetical protein BURMUCF1_0359 [Burkholderia multivorans ATCC BAA-247]